MQASNPVIAEFLAEFRAKLEQRIPDTSARVLCEYCYNSDNCILAYSGFSKPSYSTISKLLLELGMAVKETRSHDNHYYLSMRSDEITAFVNYYENIREVHFAFETNCQYYEFSDRLATKQRIAPQITQVCLADYGMCYAIRLCDGRFIVIDSGREFQVDADALMACLKEGSPYEEPRIAAWFFTHPHCDHIYSFAPFMDTYGDRVSVERLIFTFPDCDDEEQFPNLAKKNATGRYASTFEGMRDFFDHIRKYRLPTVCVHTGQVYNIGDAVCEILSSQDDYYVPEGEKLNINGLSTVIRMTLGGQVILWCADAQFARVKLAERYGDYLKADILQVPHHGFVGGSAEGYELISPEVCLLPVSHYDAYFGYGAFVESTKYLMTKIGVREMIDGDCRKTLTLPYTAKLGGAEELRLSYEDGQAATGAKCWFFSDLSTASGTDGVFSLVNTTAAAAVVTVDLYFEDPKQVVRHISAEVPKFSMLRIDLKTGENLLPDTMAYNPDALSVKGLPENARYAARFCCVRPIFVSQSGKVADYHS